MNLTYMLKKTNARKEPTKVNVRFPLKLPRMRRFAVENPMAYTDSKALSVRSEAIGTLAITIERKQLEELHDPVLTHTVGATSGLHPVQYQPRGRVFNGPWHSSDDAGIGKKTVSSTVFFGRTIASYDDGGLDAEYEWYHFDLDRWPYPLACDFLRASLCAARLLSCLAFKPTARS